MAKHNIFPAILDRSETGLAAKVTLVKSWHTPIHLDFVDGSFAKPRSAQGDLLSRVPRGSSVHLMVKTPTDYFSWAKKVGFQSLVVHIEGNEVLSICRSRPKGMKMVAAIKSSTPIAQLTPWAKHIDGIHIMMGPIGSYGGAFQIRMVKRITDIHRLWPKIAISCDVGLTQTTIPSVFAAGATTAVVGSYIFAHQHPEKQWANLQQLLKKM